MKTRTRDASRQTQRERERPVEASHHSAVFRNRQPETHTLTGKKSWRILNRVILSVSSSSRWHGATSEKMSLLAGPISRRLPKYQVSSSFVRSPQMIRRGVDLLGSGLVVAVGPADTSTV
ncbi:hypothetical protein quinque_012410 [Culex quinquefasciatus]